MPENPLELDFDAPKSDTAPVRATVHSSPALAAEPPAVLEPLDDLPPLPDLVPKETGSVGRLIGDRNVREVAIILGGVFLVVAIFAWIILTFVFVEKDEDESTLELPRNRTESVMMELPSVKLRHEGSISKKTKNQDQTVFIVEIEASIIVQGTAGELLEAEALLKSHQHRIEEVIDETIRTATPENMAEADALVIRGRIRDRINEFFPRPFVKEVLFVHYRAFHTPIKS
jgi:flagellar basal body-associated protein FliL